MKQKMDDPIHKEGKKVWDEIYKNKKLIPNLKMDSFDLLCFMVDEAKKIGKEKILKKSFGKFLLESDYKDMREELIAKKMTPEEVFDFVRADTEKAKMQEIKTMH